MIDYITHIKATDCSKILINNSDKVNEKIQKLVEGGFDKLQVISDFDQTITKQHVNGKPVLHAYALLKACPSVPSDVANTVTELTEKYKIADRDPNLAQEKKMQLMGEWWNKTIDAYKGLNITQEEINKICLEMGPPIRDNSKKFFNDLKKEDVPVLLLSAGVGEFLEPVLKRAEITGNNIELIANYLKRDNKGRIQGYQAPAIHTVNKNEYNIKNTQFYKKVNGRQNVLIMGDHLGDAGVAEKLDQVQNSLKIGFFYGEAEILLPIWMNTFDIVLKDDQTMNVPISILELLQNK